MASSKYKGSLRKKRNSELGMVVRSLKKENVYLQKTLADLSRLYSEYYKLVERFISLETVRLENSEHQMAKDENTAMPSEQLSERDGNQTDVVNMERQRIVSSCARKMEEIKNKLVSISTRRQHLEKKFAGRKNSASNKQGSTTSVQELQNHLTDALEKNKQWQQYDQQREDYVTGIVAKMLWLEKQLNEANQAQSQQHNEDHSDEKMRKMQEHYERVLQKAKDELEVHREQIDMTHQNLIKIQNWCEEREMEVVELGQQLKIEIVRTKSATEEHHYSENKEQQLEDIQCRLDDEKRRSANFELQANLFQKFMMNHHHADQWKIADLERQIKIISQDLEDERQNCLYLTKQIIRIPKKLQKNKDHLTKESERDQQDQRSREVTLPPSQLSRQSLSSSSDTSLLKESFLECPGCQAEYPASHYKELINHLEICLN